MADRLYTAKELAQLLNCNPQTIYRWGYKGLLKTKKVNGLRRFEMPDKLKSK